MELEFTVTVTLIVLMVLVTPGGADRENVQVLSANGYVNGFSIPSHYSAYDRKRINVFLGIPYAKRLEQYDDWRREFRFRKPEHPYWQGVWDATYYRPACPQHMWYIRQTVPSLQKHNVSEDCLYLNIFAPNNTDEPISNSPSLYPVMVFIHGGGYTLGSSHQYPGVFLAERGIVVVTINYRLGPLGFLSTNDQNSAGNYGMFDQVRALEWIRLNIDRFRGNPNVVTLFGQSTGAASVGLHLLSPRSDKLFQRAILQSGSDRSEWSYIEGATAAEYAKDLAWELGCPNDDNFRLVQCIQLYRTADEIVNASAKVPTRNGYVGNPWGPTVDGPINGAFYAFLPGSPKSMREQAYFKKIKIMAGLNKDEGSLFVPNLKTLENGVSSTEFGNIVNEFLVKRNVEDLTGTGEAIKFQYTYWPDPQNESMIRSRISDMMSDYMFGTGLDQVVKVQSLYIYQNIYKTRYFCNRNVSEYMISLWTNFSSSGDPTPRTFDMKFFRGVTWGEYNFYNHSYFSIGNFSKNLTNYRQSDYGFWRKYFPQIAIRPYYITTSIPQEAAKAEFQTATWSLTAACGLLVIILLAMCIVLYRRRPKDY
ncbi:acetylcholinesterase-like [Ylistrum balloti]|uniref:acetylcholinesterase-like n=1 Tax=Ylistrum balloti TaxID=509963 RepID=UPI00290591AA|nr:acetylcholinesterase-like [Ylistrum balloti]